MSKYVKDLIATDLRRRLADVKDCVLVSVAGMDANRSHKLRMELRAKRMNLLVVKNSLAARAVEGTSLAPAFHGLTGPAAIVWGGTDVVDLAKEITRLAADKQYEKLQPRGGVMEGAPLSAAEVEQVSKWPSREEQLSLLVGQILGPGARLAAQLGGPASTLASQINEKAAGGESSASEPAAEPSASEV
jgi:large subunit ribosomal protein L10